MTRFLGWITAFATILAVAGSTASIAQNAKAQDAIAPRPVGAIEEDGSRYRPAPQRSPSNSIAHQKALLRAEQRMARQAALKWYGFSASRPTASGIPWTTMYSPAWAMPGGRPFGWYFSSRPVVIITGPTTSYR